MKFCKSVSASPNTGNKIARPGAALISVVVGRSPLVEEYRRKSQWLLSDL